MGIEPTLPKEHDFESCASTNSATLAKSFQKYIIYYKKFIFIESCSLIPNKSEAFPLFIPISNI